MKTAARVRAIDLHRFENLLRDHLESADEDGGKVSELPPEIDDAMLYGEGRAADPAASPAIRRLNAVCY